MRTVTFIAGRSQQRCFLPNACDANRYRELKRTDLNLKVGHEDLPALTGKNNVT